MLPSALLLLCDVILNHRMPRLVMHRLHQVLFAVYLLHASSPRGTEEILSSNFMPTSVWSWHSLASCRNAWLSAAGFKTCFCPVSKERERYVISANRSGEISYVNGKKTQSNQYNFIQTELGLGTAAPNTLLILLLEFKTHILLLCQINPMKSYWTTALLLQHHL